MIKSILLWASLILSTILSAGFFFSLGDGWISGLFLAALGVIFEGLKAFSWKRVGEVARAYLWLAVPCTTLSLMASVGYASLTLERGWSEDDARVVKSAQLGVDTAALDREETALVEAIQKLPPGWTTSALRLTERLDAIRASRGELPAQIESEAGGVSTAALAASLGRRFGLNAPWVVTLLLFAIATLLEVGIVVLALDRNTSKHRQTAPERRATIENAPQTESGRFLEQALRPDGTLLGRRRLVELGWSERQVRDHVTSLIKTGVLTHNGRGSAIRLAPQEGERT
jgi:hypothetical protein